MKIKDILRHKGHEVVTASAGDRVLQAVRLLVDRNIGGVVVVEGEEVIGILTEGLEIKQAAVETMERLERGIPPDMEWSSRDAWSL